MSHDLFGEAPADDLTRMLSGTSDLLNFDSLDYQLQRGDSIGDRISDMVLGQDAESNPITIEPKSDKHVFEYQQPQLSNQ